MPAALRLADPRWASLRLRVGRLWARLAGRRPAGDGFDARPVHAAHSSADPAESNTEQLLHDLRNQLTIVAAYARDLGYLVPRGYADVEIAELRKRVDRASLLARELLAPTSEEPATPQPLNLNEAVTRSMALLTTVTGRRIRIQLRLAPAAVMVTAHPQDCERILINLVQNAREVLPGDGVITIETALDTQRGSEPCVRLTVTDTGAGMIPDIRDRALTPYFTTKPAGAGLGLNAVALTARQLGGTVKVDSEPGRGTAVSVYLPVAP